MVLEGDLELRPKKHTARYMYICLKLSKTAKSIPLANLFPYDEPLVFMLGTSSFTYMPGHEY